MVPDQRRDCQVPESYRLERAHLVLEQEVEDRQAAMRYAFQKAGVDSVTVGYKSTAEIDEAIDRMNRVMNA